MRRGALAKGPVLSPADWWRALLVMGAMTGWRIGQLLELRREDVDLAEGFVITRAAHNKGKRDRKIELHPLAVEHLLPHGFPALLPFLWAHGVCLTRSSTACKKTPASS